MSSFTCPWLEDSICIEWLWWEPPQPSNWRKYIIRYKCDCNYWYIIKMWTNELNRSKKLICLKNDSWMRVVIWSFIEHLSNYCKYVSYASASTPWSYLKAHHCNSLERKTWDNDGKSRQWEGVPLSWPLSQLAEQKQQRGELHKKCNHHFHFHQLSKITLTFILPFW